MDIYLHQSGHDRIKQCIGELENDGPMRKSNQ